MKICIIGGSGFVGTHLIRALKGHHKIVIIDKSPSEVFPELVVKGDIRDQEFLNENLTGFDLVIHLAAEHKDNVEPTSLYYDVNVEGMGNILEAMDRNRIKDIIFTSSVWGASRFNIDLRGKTLLLMVPLLCTAAERRYKKSRGCVLQQPALRNLDAVGSGGTRREGR